MGKNWVAILKRGWAAVAHPQRRGPADPTWSQISVALIALGSVVIAIDTLKAPTRITPAGSELVPNQDVLWIGLVIVGFGVLGVFLLALTAFLRWKDDRVTPFGLYYDPADGQCVEDLSSQRKMQLRVGVRNAGSVGVQRVRVFMRILEGAGRSYFLHLQHDNDPLRHVSRGGEYLTINQMSYFDVALVNQEERLFFFCYADQDITAMSGVPLGSMSWQIRLEVSGWTDFRDVVPLAKDYRLAVDSEDHVTLTEMQ